MPTHSKTDNVRKRCECATWKTCAHPWYLDFQQHKIRFRDNLDLLIDHHCADFTEAKNEARRAIVAKLEGRDPKGIVPSDDPTIAELLAEYDREKPRRDRWQIGRIVATTLPGDVGRTLGQWRIGAVTPETLKAFRRTRPLVAGNRDLALLRAAFNWAVLGGLVKSSPFRIGDVTAVRLTRETARTRRLQPGEAERLLESANSLHDVITAALETGCRRGELLSMQWHQIRFHPRAEIFLPAGKTKTKRDRRIPISSVLAAVLTRRRTDPSGAILPPEAYVFGDEIGRRRPSIVKAWLLTLHRAKIDDLHFHDLRREAGSRWMDAGIPLATIQRWLGHANIAQTSTYLGASLGADELDMRTYEARIGRVTLSDVLGGSNGLQSTPSDPTPNENAQQNPIVH